MAGLRRAMGLQPDGDHQHAKEVLAGLYLLQNRDIESEALYEEMLSKNPQQQVALLGLARVAAFRGQTERAKAYLDRAAKAGVPDLVMQLEYAAFYLSAGEIAEAKALLKELVLKEPNLVRAWSMIVAINIKEKDTAGLYESVRRVQSIKEGNALLLATATGYLAMLQEDLVGAVMAFEKALSLSPSSVQILEWLVRLDLLQGAGPAVERRLTQLLELDPGNAFGNYVRAGLQIGRKDYELARDSLERSLETRKSPEAHNDLAWLLMEGGAFAEAETHARAALALQPSLCPAWDTLGVLMVKTKRFDEARVAFTKALELQPDNVTVAMNLIELDLRQGRKQEAAQRLDNVALRVDDLSADEQTNYQKLRQEL
jgi:Tfp pilus assembly protein PilF